ncbi:MAG: hypothetical protein D6B27_04130 [Gammaproteobacteria bacterium]|nr:MAG: hypothetical protein D6B27_04130 [Gammaproteobacteria bacterium]
MKSRLDIPMLKLSITVFCVVVLICATAIAGSYYFMYLGKTEFGKARNNLQSKRSAYEELIQKNNLFVEYAKKFNQLKSKGMVGNENRLSWIEALQHANSSLKLPQINYNISPQKLIPPEMIDPAIIEVSVTRTAMELQLEMLHEGDLFHLLEVLKQKSGGYFILDECTMNQTRRFKEEEIDITKANIRSNCKLSWIQVSLQPPIVGVTP